MTTPRTIDSYGGIFADEFVVVDPTVEVSSAFDNVLHEDVAEMSRVPVKGIVRWTTTGTAAVVAVTPTSGRSQMGTGSGQWPTIFKTATGTYEVAYPGSFTNGLGVSESIAIFAAIATVGGVGLVGQARATVIGGTTVSVEIRDSTEALSDLGAAGEVTLFVY